MNKETINKLRIEFKVNFPFYASKCLKIRTKTKGLQPFNLNSVQHDLNQKIEEALRLKGNVRFIILKARQMGVSTFVNARFFHQAVFNSGVKTMVLTHQDSATKELFAMTRCYYDHCPDEFKPKATRDSANELAFNSISSTIKTGTAGSKNVGHGSTIQCLHWSEVSRSPYQAEMTTGVMQTVPTGDGTMIILESTAKGTNEYFYQTWQAAMRGENDFTPIFYPWTAMAEYQADPTGIEFSGEEKEYQKLYGVSDEQLAWRHKKLKEFEGSPERRIAQFKEQYPITPEEAFQQSDSSFISAESVYLARKATYDGVGAIVIGLDPARKGRDSTGLIVRQGRKVIKAVRWKLSDLMTIASRCAEEIDEYNADAVFVDTVGLGAGVYDRLKQMGYGDVIYEAVASARADNSDRFANKRAEMWARMDEWLLSGADIPDSDLLESDLLLLGYGYDSHNRLKLESKKELNRSPDVADALAMTFYLTNIRSKHNDEERSVTGTRYRTVGGSMIGSSV